MKIINGDIKNYNQVNKLTTLALSPTTIGAPAETYTFTIENTNVVKFADDPTSKTVTRASAALIAQSVNPGATTTITVTGLNSGVTNIVTVSVKADAASSKDPSSPQQTVRTRTATRRRVRRRQQRTTDRLAPTTKATTAGTATRYPDRDPRDRGKGGPGGKDKI